MSSHRTYEYRAVQHDGHVARGRVAADSHADALTALSRQGLFAFDVRALPVDRDRRTSISDAELALGLRMLADLLEAGLPVNRALHIVTDLVPRSWSSLVTHLKQSVREGKSLGAAFGNAPAAIPPLVIGMTIAGEMAGDLGAAVRRAADVVEAASETQAAIRNALAYPAILAIAGGGAIALMVAVVIPRFAAILADLGQALPKSTQLVLTTASALRTAFWPFAATCIIAAVAVRAWTASENGRRRWHGLLLRIPVIGHVRRASSTSRTAFTLATLLETAVPLRQALRLAARASGDDAIAARVLQAAARIETGTSMARALADANALTPVAARLVHAGEESGRLPSLLRHAAKLEQQRSDRITRSSVRMLEPALILLFAGVVALVAAALLQAVYSVRPNP